jgi:hypothetical protein
VVVPVVTALMHAAMHGYAALTHMLLLHGADPLLEQRQGQNSIGLAALYGRPAILGTIFRADPSLVVSVDSKGRTPLHWAVASKHTPTVKYILGRWDADVNAIDGEGNTPLHLAEVREIAALLIYGTSHAASLSAKNAAGFTPAMAAAAAGATRLAEELDEGSDASLLTNRGSIDRRLFAFMLDSPLRQPPPTTLPNPWVCRMSFTHATVACVPLVPHVAIAMGATALATFAVSAVYGFGAAAAAICTRASTRAHTSSGSIPSHMAPLLFGAVLAAGATHCLAVVPSAHGVAQWPACGGVGALCMYWFYWVRLVCSDPGFLPAAQPADNRQYWVAMERLPAGASAPEHFCERSELQIRPRAAYSKLSRGMVRAMDHDCPWVDRTIGGGNHVDFVAMLLWGELALLCAMATMWYSTPTPEQTWVEAATAGPTAPTDPHLFTADEELPLTLRALGNTSSRARQALAAIPLQVVLLQGLTPLLCVHLWLLSINLTTREHIMWLRVQHTHKAFPMPGSDEWRAYAPYDRGCFQNILSFIRRRRGVEAGRHRDENPSSPRGEANDDHELIIEMKEPKFANELVTPEASIQRPSSQNGSPPSYDSRTLPFSV